MSMNGISSIGRQLGRMAAVIGSLGLAAAGGAQNTPAPTPGGQGVTLSPAFKVGDEFSFTQTINRTDRTKLAMGEQTLTVNQKNQWTGKVTEVKGTTATIELQFKSINVSLNEETRQGDAPGTPTTASWDSIKAADDRDSSNPLVTAFKPFVGARFKMTVDGHLIKGVEQIDTFSIPITKYAQFVRQTLDTDQIRNRWQPLLGVKTDTPMATPGQEWTEVVKMPTPQIGIIQETTKRTLATSKDGMANVNWTGSIEILPPSAEMAAQGKVKNSNITGTGAWDAKTGMPKSFEWKQVWTMEVNAQGFIVDRTSDWTMAFTRN